MAASSDVELERRLEALAAQVPCPPLQPFTEQILHRIAAAHPTPAHPTPAHPPPALPPSVRHPNRRRRASLVAVAIAASVLILPGPRGAVARWFGFDSVRIERGPAPTVPASTTTDTTTAAPGRPSASTSDTSPAAADALPGLGPSVSSADAAAMSGLPLPTPSALGPPASIHVVDIRGVIQLVAVYAPAAALPPSPVVAVGALVSVFPAHIDEGYFGKFLDTATTIESFTLDGSKAIWIEGAPHQIAVVVDGEPLVDTLRLATNTLLWERDGLRERDGLVLRIEANVTRAAALRIAATWEPDSR